jgi:hypothetical protein
MRTIKHCVPLNLLGLILAGCTLHDRVLEKKDVQFFKVEEISTTHPTVVRISGLAFMSAMSVGRITTGTESSSMVVQVHVALAKPGTSGSFQYDLLVPDSVSQVKFGTSEIPIWRRGSHSSE